MPFLPGPPFLFFNKNESSFRGILLQKFLKKYFSRPPWNLRLCILYIYIYIYIYMYMYIYIYDDIFDDLI